MSLHQKLLDQIAAYDCADPRCSPRPPIARCTRHALAAALRVGVELHAPVEHGAFGTLCGACSQTEGRDVLRFVSAPCPEVQAIARELGIEVTDRG